MRFFPIIAHGAGLVSTLALMVISGVGALLCFIAAGVIGFDNSEPARRRVIRLVAAAVACIGIGVLSPWIAQTLGLP